tara:strand:+ start:3184 stop:3750 length:567 start_codon:yes stop_codon:yes gene_type:complete
MPDLKDIVSARNKKGFVKHAYRPWDLTGNDQNESSTSNVIIEEKEVSLKSIPEPKAHSDTADHISNKPSETIKPKNTIPEDKKEASSPAISMELQLTNLTGLQKKILNIIINMCSKDRLETGPIHTKALADNITASIGSTKVSINRLITKGFITREKGKTSKGGFLNLRVNEEAYSVLLRINSKSTNL